MEVQFTATKRQEEELKAIREKLEAVRKALSPYMDEADTEKMERLRLDIQKKVEKFRKEDRKLTLAVIGRVKAGKSTFLNELVFGGKNILPHAFRPKTATLTKIEYDEHPHLEISYYTPSEWADLEQLAAKEGSVREDVKTARELVGDVRESGLDVRSYLEKGKETIPLPDEGSLETVLDRYVGAEGVVTPIVKNVTLCIAKPELAGISIVDTPGTNDPIVSRTMTTKRFLAECDVVFFLTSGDQALDREDIDLLEAQLPGQGVGQIILIDSKFDDVIVGASDAYDSLEKAIAGEKESFTRRTERVFRGFAEEYERYGRPELAQLMRSCMKPLFLSSRMHRMAREGKENYSDPERNTFENLDFEHGDMTEEIVKKLGDMTPIEDAFHDVIAHKDEKLAGSVRAMVPALRGRIRTDFQDMAERAKQQRLFLETHDRKELLTQQKAMEGEILAIKGDVGDQFTQLMTDMEEAKSGMMGELNSLASNYSILAEKTGTEQHVKHYTVSDSHWYNPFSWGKSHEESYTYNTNYKYVDASDALESLRKYAYEAQNLTDQRMASSIDLKHLKERLLHTIVAHMDTSSSDFNPDQMRIIVQQTLNRIELPVFHVSLDQYVNEISSKYSGEIREARDREDLKKALAKSVEELMQALITQVTESVRSFKAKMTELQGTFSDSLLAGINDEFEELTKQMEEKEKNIDRLKTYEGLLDKYKNI